MSNNRIWFGVETNLIPHCLVINSLHHVNFPPRPRGFCSPLACLHTTCFLSVFRPQSKLSLVLVHLSLWSFLRCIVGCERGRWGWTVSHGDVLQQSLFCFQRFVSLELLGESAKHALQHPPAWKMRCCSVLMAPVCFSGFEMQPNMVSVQTFKQSISFLSGHFVKQASTFLCKCSNIPYSVGTQSRAAWIKDAWIKSYSCLSH